MIISPFFRRPRNRWRRAFSLVEVTLAIGIVAFAFLALFGLIPTGLNVFRSAIDASIGSQILDQVVQAAQQTDYQRLVDAGDTSPDTYYDEQGNLLVDDQGAPVAKYNDPRSIYTVHVGAKTPTAIPATGSNGDGTNQTLNVAKLTVKIAKNPGHNQTPFANARPGSYNTYIAYVARNRSAFETKNQ